MTTHRILTSALVAQVALAAVTWWPSNPTAVPPTPLVPGGAEAITAVEILGNTEDAPVRLEKQGEDWVVASAHGFPADADKVDELLDKLDGIALRRPIARTAASHEALKVDEESWEKKVTVTAGGTDLTAYVGAAASKAIHLRLEGADEVHKIEGVNAWSLRATSRGYLPTNAAAFEADALTAFSLENAQGAVSLVKEGDAWRPAATDGLEVDVEALEGVLDKAGRLRLVEVLGTAPEPAMGLDGAGSLRVRWTASGDEGETTGAYVLGAEAEGDRYARLEGQDFVFETSDSRLGELVDLDPTTLLRPPAPEAPPEDAAPDAPGE